MNNKADTKKRKFPGKSELAPKLRFPSFEGLQGWELVPLHELAFRCKQRNDDGEIKCVLTNSAEHGVVNQRDYFDKDIATQGKLENYYIVEKGDYVYNPRISATAPVGPISKNNIGKGVMSPLYTVFRFKNTENSFYAHYFKSAGWHAYLRQSSSTGARHDRMAITNDGFMAMPLPVASSGEMQKVSDCLNSISDLIAEETKKLHTLKAHKSGLMQSLFPAENETIPKVRFPNFRNSAEWSVKKIGEIANLFKGKGISKADVTADGAQPCIRYGELYTIYGETISDIASSTNINASALFLSKANDVIIPASGETKIDIAKASCVMVDGIALGSDLNVIRSNQNGIFLSYQMNWPLRQSIAKVAQGDTVVHLYPSQIEQLDVKLPSLSEQQEISDFFVSIDELINGQVKKIEMLKSHRWRLMQQLFPSQGEEQE